MSGNVMEWCSDWKSRYSSDSQTNPMGPEEGIYRVQRGGNYKHDAGTCRVSARYSDDPVNRYPTGFRLVMIP